MTSSRASSKPRRLAWWVLFGALAVSGAGNYLQYERGVENELKHRALQNAFSDVVGENEQLQKQKQVPKPIRRAPVDLNEEMKALRSRSRSAQLPLNDDHATAPPRGEGGFGH